MKGTRSAYLACASATALLWAMAAGPASAQDQTGGQSATAPTTASDQQAAPASDLPKAPPAPTPQAADDQSAPTNNPNTLPASDSADQTTKDIVVTGTNISGVKPVGSETIALDRAQILATGATNITDVLQTVPQVQNNPNAGGAGPVYRQGGTSGYGGNSTQGTAINLRGLGTAATLTLVDGRRIVPSGAAATFTEAIQVPIAALDRIEVVADGNSAIYGSDAISGVVNYVLRKNFEGVEITGRDQFDRFNNEWGVSITGGHSWGSGDIIATYDHDFRQPFVEGKSKFLRLDQVPIGGQDLRANNATVGVASPTLIVGGNGVPYSYYTLPANAGPGLTFSQLTPGANLVDAADYTDYLGRQTREQAALFFNQDLAPTLSMFVESFYTKRDTESRAYGNSRIGNNLTVCQGSPYFISGAPAAAIASNSLCNGGNAELIAVNPITFFNGPAVTENPDETVTVTGGLVGHLPHRWNLNTYFTYAHDSTCGICNYGNNANGAELAAEVISGQINPYSTTPLSAAQYQSFFGTNTQLSYNTFLDAVIRLDGPLFSLPGGDVRTAFGGELAYNRQHLVNGSNNAFESNPTDNDFAITNAVSVHRSTASAFGELFIPIVGEDMHVPLMRSLNIDAAVRYDDYSDFGTTTNPKVGATWFVTDGISIRGSWGTSFRAPALTDTNPQNYSSAIYGYPLSNTSGRSDIGFLFPGYSSTYIILGANPDLKPETATSWSAGFDIKPVGSGFKFSTTYFNVRYANQIVGQNLGLFLSSPANAALYSQYIIPVHNPANCVNGNPATYDPVLANYIAQHPALYNTQVVGSCSVNVILDGRSANAATTFQDGLDFETSYSFNTGKSHWIVGANVTKILDETLQTIAGAAEASVLDTYYYPISLRGRGQVGWSRGRLGANVFVNYVGSYTNTIPVAGQSNSTVPSWTTVDLGVVYSIPKHSSLLSGLRLSANIQNIADRDPPTVFTSANTTYDASNANIFGRIFSLQVTKDF